MNIYRHLKHLFYKIDIWIKSKKTPEGIEYIYVNNSAKQLVLVFDGIGADYNYRRSFRKSSWDQLYIKDSWAGGVSYYLYENGNNHPEKITSDFIVRFLLNHHYNKIVTFGSSKGGSSALYFGLKHHFDEVYAGACQYRVGDYIGIYHELNQNGYYKRVMGDMEKNKGICLLNGCYERIIEENNSTKTVIHLLYSKCEHTYKDHIIHLISKLDQYNIQHIDIIEQFSQHSMIGNYMKSLCSKFR